MECSEGTIRTACKGVKSEGVALSHPFFSVKGWSVMPLLILLIILFLVPWLAFVLLGFFLLFWLILLPLGFAGRSIFWLFAGPSQLFRILLNRKVRENHALEHATIHVLESQTGIAQIEGTADENGFAIRGLLEPETVYEAAIQALRRLKAGETSLAIHPKCGTTVVIVNTLASLIFIIILFTTGNLNLLNVVLALVIAHITGPLSSKVVQQYVTTSPQVDPGLEITGVSVKHPQGNTGFIQIMGPVELYIHTGRDYEEVQPEIVG